MLAHSMGLHPRRSTATGRHAPATARQRCPVARRRQVDALSRPRQIGWASVALGFLVGSRLVVRALRPLLLPVIFVGPIADPSSSARKRMRLIAAAIVLPLLLNLIAGFVLDWLK